MRTYALVFFCIFVIFPLSGCHKKEIARMNAECARLEAFGNATGARVAVLEDEIGVLRAECARLVIKMGDLKDSGEALDLKIEKLSELIEKIERLCALA